MNPNPTNMASDTLAVEVKGLVKTFGFRRVLRGLDFTARKGESVIIFGANGAGKTTFMKILATLSRPDSGTVKIDGLDWMTEATEVRKHLGAVFHQPFLYEDLTGEENLLFFGRMYGVADVRERIRVTLEEVGMIKRAQDRVRTLSHGMRKRIAIARAFLHNPPILLFDEPETGLDQEGLNLLWRLLDASGKTVIMTTHSLEQGLLRGDRAVILGQGKILFQEACCNLDITVLHATYQELTKTRS